MLQPQTNMATGRLPSGESVRAREKQPAWLSVCPISPLPVRSLDALVDDIPPDTWDLLPVKVHCLEVPCDFFGESPGAER